MLGRRGGDNLGQEYWKTQRAASSLAAGVGPGESPRLAADDTAVAVEDHHRTSSFRRIKP